MSGKRKEDKWRIPRGMLMQALVPGTVSALALALANIADALTVGIRIGETALAAIGILTPVFMIYNVISVSLGSGGGVTHARLSAGGEKELAMAHFRRIARWALGISVTIGLLGSLFPGFVLRSLAAGEDYPGLWKMCMDYARPLLAAAPLFILNVFLYYFVENDDHPRLAAIASTAGGLLDLGLNILLVLILNRGVRGAVWATVTAQAVSLGILITHFSSERGILRIREILRKHEADPRMVHRYTAGSMRNGISSAVSYAFLFIFQLMVNHLLMGAGRRGGIPADLYIAVFDLVMNIAYFFQPLYNAAGDALQPSAATFSVERDRESLRYVRRLTLLYTLGIGLLIAALLGILARPVSRLFGLGTGEQLAAAVPAIRIYLLSTPFTGFLVIMGRYYQALRKPWMVLQGTILRDAFPLIPAALLLGLLRPAWIWWAFLPAEALGALLFQMLRRRAERREKGRQCPMCRAVLTNSNRELGSVVEKITAFCEEQEIPMARAVQLQLAVEEICAVTMQKAFSGRKDEYIQVTLVIEEGPRYVLHIRDSAPYFNPLDLRMEKVRKDMESSIMDSIGVMMVRKQSTMMVYRNYQGFNTMTVVYE